MEVHNAVMHLLAPVVSHEAVLHLALKDSRFLPPISRKSKGSIAPNVELETGVEPVRGCPDAVLPIGTRKPPGSQLIRGI